MRSFQKGTVWPCSLKDFKVTSVQSWTFARKSCFDSMYIVNRAFVVTGQTLKAGSSVTFQPTRSKNTSLKRSHQFLNNKEVYKDIAIYLNRESMPFHSITDNRSALIWMLLYVHLICFISNGVFFYTLEAQKI